MTNWRRIHCFCCLQFLLLAVLQTSSDAYVSVNLEHHCKAEGAPTIMHLQSRGLRAAITVELNVMTSHTPTADPQTGDARCRLEVVAPPSHILTVHLFNPNRLLSPAFVPQKKAGFLPCFLKVTSKESEEDVILRRSQTKTVDLCNSGHLPWSAEQTLTSVTSSHLSLTWSPPDKQLAEKIIATHLVITAVGKGVKECNARDQSYCSGSKYHAPTCIPSELVCDGFLNCPSPGNDESPEECAVAAFKSSLVSSGETHQKDPHQILGAFLTRAVMRQIGADTDAMSTTTSKPWQKNKGLELTSDMLKGMSDMILKKLLSKHQSVHSGEDTNSSSTTTSRPLWHTHSSDSSKMNSVPTTLAHYGPWGYLMLGMLVCGAVLMLCGLWECCCRAPKHRRPAGGPPSTSAATTVFIINSASGISGHRNVTHSEETPPTAGPPSYEELDQPPSYSSLFPITKICDADTTTIEENHVIVTDHI